MQRLLVIAGLFLAVLGSGLGLRWILASSHALDSSDEVLRASTREPSPSPSTSPSAAIRSEFRVDRESTEPDAIEPRAAATWIRGVVTDRGGKPLADRRLSKLLR